MSDEHIQPVGNGGYEHEDLTAKAIYGFLMGLVVLGLVVYFAVNGIYWGLEKYSGAHQPQQNPMKRTAETDTRDTNTAKVQAEIKTTFPEPRLETDENNELTEPRMRQEEHLNSYGSVDQAAGTLHIPIDRAMQLVAERGLPVRPQNAAAAAQNDSESKGKEAAKSRTQ